MNRDCRQDSESWKIITLAVLGSALSFYALKFVPVGIKTIFSGVIGAIWAIVLGIIFFGESINAVSGLLIGAILLSGYFLGKQKNDFAHLDNNVWKGVFIVFIAQIITGFSFYYVAYVSRELSPFVAGYFWEMLIGVFAIIIMAFRPLYDGKSLHKISLQQFGKIAGICSLTLAGTGFFMYGITIGNYGIAQVMMNGAIFVSIFVAHIAFGERLTKRQWIWIFALMAEIIALNFVQ